MNELAFVRKIQPEFVNEWKDFDFILAWLLTNVSDILIATLID